MLLRPFTTHPSRRHPPRSSPSINRFASNPRKFSLLRNFASRQACISFSSIASASGSLHNSLHAALEVTLLPHHTLPFRSPQRKHQTVRSTTRPGRPRSLSLSHKVNNDLPHLKCRHHSQILPDTDPPSNQTNLGFSLRSADRQPNSIDSPTDTIVAPTTAEGVYLPTLTIYELQES